MKSNESNKNQDNIYELFNDIELETSEYEAGKLSEFESKKYKHNFKKSLEDRRKASNSIDISESGLDKSYAKTKSVKSKKTRLAVAIAIVLVITAPLLSADFRAKLKDYAYSLSSAFGNGTEEDSLALNEVIETDDVEIKVSDLIADENSITLNMLVDSSKLNLGEKKISGFNFDDVGNENNIKLILNGKELYISGCRSEYKNIEENIENSIITFKFDKKIELKEDNILEIKIKDMTYCESEMVGSKPKPEHKTIAINKDFEIKASREELMGGAKENSDKTIFKTEIADFTLNHIVFHKVLPKLEFTTNDVDNFEFGDIYLEAEITYDGKKAIFYSDSANGDGKTNNYYLLYSNESELKPEALMDAEEFELELRVIELTGFTEDMTKEEAIEYKKKVKATQIIKVR